MVLGSGFSQRESGDLEPGPLFLLGDWWRISVGRESRQVTPQSMAEGRSGLEFREFCQKGLPFFLLAGQSNWSVQLVDQIARWSVCLADRDSLSSHHLDGTLGQEVMSAGGSTWQVRIVG